MAEKEDTPAALIGRLYLRQGQLYEIEITPILAMLIFAYLEVRGLLPETRDESNLVDFE